MENDNLDHRRFLKSSNSYKIGEYIPDVIVQDSNDISLQWLKDSLHGSAMFFFSNNCEACDINVAYETCRRYNKFCYAIFCEGYDEEAILELQKKYTKENIKVYSYKVKYLIEQLNVRAVPYMLVVNKIGQVIGAGIVNTCDHANKLMEPLLRFIERE
ncbi:hypothetical protein M5X00_27300 [Paenibacillus alvei]|uniref:Thioredoxin domain-containing protein n=1 Tax=Paenibacillus alvei TaxID=44250 RepID=A0ABT4H603_PAEAL|nr:hypothetical protein [Paenibacillus alvei]MCY9545286.1 hypothetical protein [Paenibacillus alvei]MCY9706659.1 hypothetical protein [Paenibacillus alvei]MCY9736628.1 hypothetical protein [Paenibacillus alvei]MCY9757936.1 hypothetical protein [Paenibacillus alvei]MCY9764324.1 hypothetical protein [Paenibacillus alvei]